MTSLLCFIKVKRRFTYDYIHPYFIFPFKGDSSAQKTAKSAFDTLLKSIIVNTPPHCPF